MRSLWKARPPLSIADLTPYYMFTLEIFSCQPRDDLSRETRLSVPDGSTAALEQTVGFLKDNLLGESFLQLGHLHINFSWRSLLLYLPFFSPSLILPV